MVSGGGFAVASGSGSGGDGGGEGDRPESPPRDLARGKGPVVTEGASKEVPVERPEFVPAAVSSGHQPISKSDFTEYVSDDVLARLLEKNPMVVAAVFAACEER